MTNVEENQQQITDDEQAKLAVQQDGYALLHVQNQTEEICKLTVQKNGYALGCVQNQTEEICKLAVQQNGGALCYVAAEFRDKL